MVHGTSNRLGRNPRKLSHAAQNSKPLLLRAKHQHIGYFRK